MKNFAFYSLILVLAIILSACGAQPVPTINAADVQHTAEAAAFTMVAQTQEAMPTATPLPPTDTPTNTPPPTDTPAALPTSATTTVVAANTVAVNTVPAGNATVDPCDTRILSYSPKGRETIIRIANSTKTSVTVSLYLHETEGAGECGYRSYTIAKVNDVVITDLVQGCYSLLAWSTDPKIHVNASGYGCINNPDKWTFEIREDTIKFTQ